MALAEQELTVGVDAVLAFYDELPAATENDMLGDWDGQVIPTGHPGERYLHGLRWAGTRFTDRDDVDPMMCLDDSGERHAIPFFGDATLRMVEYRGASSATVVHHQQPVFEYFRKVDEGTMVGVVDRKGESEPLVFVLRRRV